MRRISLIVIAGVMSVAAPRAWSQPLRAGTAPTGQPGVHHTLSATPAIAGGWTLAAGASYGWDPDVIVEGDARHRAGGRLALGYSPWSFLTLSLAVDGLVDAYQWSDTSADSLVVGAFGDPRIGVRTGWELGGGVALGGLFELWIPSGRGAFAVDGSSLSPSVFLAFSFAPERIPLGVHLDVGYRHDRSALMLGDLSQLIPEQLLLSGASSVQHHLAVDLAVEYRLGPIAPYVEASVDVPLTETAASNVLLGLGARAWLGPGDVAQIYLGMDFRVVGSDLTPDPVTGTIATAPPVLNLQFGVVFRLPVPRAEGEAPADVAQEECESPSAPDEPSRAMGRIAGVVRCGAGPCGATARVTIDGSDASAIAPDDESGRFTTAALPAGSYEVEARSEGHQPRRSRVEVVAGAEAEVAFDLPPVSEAQEGSRIQGQVTDFQGAAVQATVLIPALDVEIETDAEGRFEVEAEPGRYDVVISAEGYRTQHSRVQVRPQETVVMNVELRGR